MNSTDEINLSSRVTAWPEDEFERAVAAFRLGLVNYISTQPWAVLEMTYEEYSEVFRK